MANPIFLRKPRDFGEKIGDTFVFIKQNFQQLFVLYVVFGLPLVLISALLQSFAVKDMMSQLSSPSFLRNPMSVFGSDLILAYILSIFVFASFATAVLVYMRLYSSAGLKKPTLQEVAQLYIKKVFILFFNLLLFFILMMVVLFMVGLIFGMIHVVLAVLAYIVLFFYGIALFAHFMPAIVMEDAPFGQAFGRCFTLSKDTFWPTLGFVVILGIIWLIIGSIVNLIIQMTVNAGNFLDVMQGREMDTNMFVLSATLTSVFGMIFQLIPHVGTNINYCSIVEEKEGTDIETRIEEIGVDNNPHGHIEEQY